VPPAVSTISHAQVWASEGENVRERASARGFVTLRTMLCATVRGESARGCVDTQARATRTRGQAGE
jgi:hypothetical protein